MNISKLNEKERYWSLQVMGRDSSVGSAWARCPHCRGFDPPLGIFSSRGDFSLGVNMGSNSIPPKTPSDESINRGHLSVRAGDSSRRSEEIVTNVELCLRIWFFFIIITFMMIMMMILDNFDKLSVQWPADLERGVAVEICAVVLLQHGSFCILYLYFGVIVGDRTDVETGVSGKPSLCGRPEAERADGQCGAFSGSTVLIFSPINSSILLSLPVLEHHAAVIPSSRHCSSLRRHRLHGPQQCFGRTANPFLTQNPSSVS